MSDDLHVTPVEDPPDPGLDELQQRPTAVIPAVPVEMHGIANVRMVPSRSGPAGTTPVASTDGTPSHLLGADPRRARATLWAADKWNYHHGRTGLKVPVPANMALTIQHCDEVYASVDTGNTVVCYVAEEYAQ